MPDKMSPEELQALSSKVASEVLQRISQTLGGDLAAGARAAKQFVFTCPGDFGCKSSYQCTQSFTTLTQTVE
jgi:hypothetical protein